jgi:hypothetical protein
LESAPPNPDVASLTTRWELHAQESVAFVNAIVATTKQYSNRSSERQSVETCSKKNLRPQALDFDERDTVTVGVRGRRLRPVPPEKTRCREPTVTALRML